uniref:Fusoxypene synthase n=1 Tax=Fusarium oxysporum TaxID=5507 RepID=FOFS_FUSOX|nr:RecName: Full=Fusoxypene synthase; Short=FS; Includes: RecName: Full=Sesterterpenoid synthase; Includes: RecName: Full=Geranylfarnesyl diphosphate synthase; Short=GFDP synthase; AltName: Full=Bifunctional terpene synthase FoFS; Short=BFTS FoFS [Fusarium oxysporum]UPT51558.1 geranylgeranyl pyrophosphate synthase [Fusarium oxysporum]
MDQLSYQSRLIPPEEAQQTGCFTSLPIRIHPRNDIADAATAKFIADWAKHVGDGREKRTHFCPSRVGNWNSLLYPEGLPERLGSVSYLLDLGLIHDDVNEELSVQDAMAAHERLRPALDPQDNRKWDPESPQMKFKMLLSECVIECIKTDRELGTAMLKSFRVLWLDIAENATSDAPQTMDDYWDVRMTNGGMSVFWPMVLYATNLRLSEEQHTLVQPIIAAAEEALCWANDYFSYEREVWELETGKAKRIVNIVEMVSRTKGLSSAEAKAEVKRMILGAEAKYCRLRDDLLSSNPEMSMDLKRWIEYIGLSISGNHYWLSACSRQNTWKTNCSIDGKINGLTNGSVNDTNNRSVDGVVNGTVDTGIEEPSTGNKDTSLKALKLLFNSTPNESHPVCRYPNDKLSDYAMVAPMTHISSLPSKGTRSELISALNVWLKVPPVVLGHISSAIDMLHNASLILDDIQDNSPLRRGVPAAHVVFGTAQSINSATFMFVKATEAVRSTLSPAALEALLRGLQTLFMGQSWDLYWKHNLQCPAEGDYIRMVDHKTGGMFVMLVQLMAAESPYYGASVIEDLERLMRLLGRFYQIRDDYMNFSAYSAQKGFAEDLDEGKFSFPVVCGFERDPELRGQILAIFRQRPTSGAGEATQLSRKVKEHLIRCIAASGGFDETLKCLRSLENELDTEIAELEKKLGQVNPLLRLCLATLSMEGCEKICW